MAIIFVTGLCHTHTDPRRLFRMRISFTGQVCLNIQGFWLWFLVAHNVLTHSTNNNYKENSYWHTQAWMNAFSPYKNLTNTGKKTPCRSSRKPESPFQHMGPVGNLEWAGQDRCTTVPQLPHQPEKIPVTTIAFYHHKINTNQWTSGFKLTMATS